MWSVLSPQKFLSLILCFCCVVGLCINQANAQSVGDLLIAPTRVVFEGRTRTAELALVNIGTNAAVYRISLVQQRMTEDGQFVPVEEPLPNELFADNLVRFSPRQVSLEPRVTQTIRLQVRKPANLPPGEYRSHLLIRAIPPADEAVAPDDIPQDSSGLGVRLIPIYGVSIPVIVRHGETNAAVSIPEAQIITPDNEDGQISSPHIQILLKRTGNCSSYGDLTVTYKPMSGEEPVILTKAAGLAVYSPNDQRRVELPLVIPETVVMPLQGRFHITYKQKPDDGGGLIAEAFILIP